MKTKLTEYIKKNPGSTFEKLQIALGACQGESMVAMVMELAALVESGMVQVMPNYLTIVRRETASYYWIGAR